MMPLIDSFFSAGTHIFVSSHTFAAGVPSGENVSASADPLTVFFAGVPSGANVSAAGVPSSGGTCRRSVQRRHWGDWFLREGGFSHPDQVDAAGHQHNAVEAEPLASAGPQPTGVHIEEEVDFDPPEQPEIEELADPAEQAEQAEEAALLAFKSHWNLTKAWERRVVEVPELTGR